MQAISNQPVAEISDVVESEDAWELPISPKQKALMARKERYLLINGPRQSSKTVGACHMLCWRAWEFQSLTSIITNTTTSGVDGGVWDLLVNHIIPLWIEGGFGFEWKRRPYKQASTQKHKCSIINKHGTVSTFELDSLDKENDAEKKFKGRYFQTIYVCELSNFRLRKSFETWVQCLRLPPSARNMRDEDLQLIADTNPSDEGEDSWIYQIWYILKNAQLPDDHPEKARQRELGLMEFKISDNPYLTKDQLSRLYAQYAYDANLSARYLEGLWVKANATGLFASVYKPLIHVVGRLPNSSDPNPEILLPQPNCTELDAGWDPGNRNLACVMGESWQQDFEVKDDQGNVVGIKPKMSFKVLDEVILIDEMPKMEDFTIAVLDKMDWWEKQVGSSVRWSHYSDRSAWRHDSKTDKLEHQIIFDVSGGRIELIRFENLPGTVAPRIRLVRRLLHDERILINNARCPRVCEMFSSIRQGATGDQSIELGSKMKHIFDALCYWLASRCSEEIERSSFRANFGKARSSKPMVLELR